MDYFREYLGAFVTVYILCFWYIKPMVENHRLLRDSVIIELLTRHRIKYDAKTIAGFKVGIRINIILFCPIWALIYFIERFFKFN